MSAVLRSLGAFLASGVRPRGRLARAIVPVLVVKVCLVLLAKIFVFGGENRVEVTPDMMDHRLGAAHRTLSEES